MYISDLRRGHVPYFFRPRTRTKTFLQCFALEQRKYKTKLMYACVFVFTGYKCVETDYKLEYFSSKSIGQFLYLVFLS